MVVSAELSSIKVHLDNLLGGGNFGESVNNLLNLLGDYIWDQLKGLLFPLLEDVLTDVINDALNGCSIADLIETGSCFRLVLRCLVSKYTEFPYMSLWETQLLEILNFLLL